MAQKKPKKSKKTIKTKPKKLVVEFRRDLVSGDWVLISSARQAKPIFFAKKEKKTISSKKGCPFEDPQKNGNKAPLLWYERPSASSVLRAEDFDNWFIQIIPNKYPIMLSSEACAIKTEVDPYTAIEGRGFHEVIVTRDHDRYIWRMELNEIELIIKTYQTRYKTIEEDKCVEYILIFHNEGPLAGASVPHPHSQLVALPIVPPDVSKSINGAVTFFEVNKKCVHCVMLDKEKEEKKRIVYENDHFLVFVPYASKVSYEVRIFPKEHSSDFEEMSSEKRPFLAEAIKESILRLRKVLNGPDYNFFIHTSSTRVKGVPYYHWHMEILPRTYKWAGMELGTGIEVVSVPPEQAAEQLRKAGK